MKTDIKSVKEVFDDYKIITVPYYQRTYVWGTDNGCMNLYKFINDIFSQYNSDPNSEYFIGTLAFCSDQTNDVIDGQQRLTSLILMLSSIVEKSHSQTIKNKYKNLLFPEDNKFVIQEETGLGDGLETALCKTENTSQNQNYIISKTIDFINNQLEAKSWKDKDSEWYVGLYNYILEKVKLMRFEFNNNGDALKYFININTFSVPLTQNEVFFSILAQAIKISGSDLKILKIKEGIKDLSIYNDINKYKFKAYDKYDNSDEEYEKGITNIIYIFLNSYISADDNHIKEIGSDGNGRWISCYRSDVYSNISDANDFVEKFNRYINDFEKIYKHLKNIDNAVTDNKSSLYLASAFLNYCKNCVIPVINIIFKFRHTYYNEQNNLYKEGTTDIDLDELNEIAKRLNLTIIKNLISYDNSNDPEFRELEEKQITGFIKYIEKNNGNYSISIDGMKHDIDENKNKINNLEYYNKPEYKYKNDEDKKYKLNKTNNSSEIKFIMCLQESYLETVANPDKDFNEYSKNLLDSDTNITIEHLYSVDEYNENDRFNKWRSKNKFEDLNSFNNIRMKFENLSLLPKSANSSAGTKNIADKINIYKTLNGNCKYLIQSLVDGSDYYNNQNIQALGLPERKIKNIDQNTWELSENNSEFNEKLLKLAIDEIANK